VNLSGALGSGNSVVLTWRKNGVNTAVACTVSGASATTCSDTADSFSYAAGDALDIQADFTGTIIATPVWVMTVPIAAGIVSNGMTLLEEHTASNSATLDFTSGITSSYDDYVIRIVTLVPVTAGSALQLRVSTDRGNSWDSGANYNWARFSFDNASTGSTGNAADSSLTLAPDVAASGASGTIDMHNPGSAIANKSFEGITQNIHTGAVSLGTTTAGAYAPTTAVNAIRVFFSSGNITSGTVRLYGLSK
jgi:hypothetical protein